ncbi:MAG: hypothetical protein RIR48_1567, partial [Bacteroidota bacterium]
FFFATMFKTKGVIEIIISFILIMGEKMGSFVANI